MSDIEWKMSDGSDPKDYEIGKGWSLLPKNGTLEENEKYIALCAKAVAEKHGCRIEDIKFIVMPVPYLTLVGTDEEIERLRGMLDESKWSDPENIICLIPPGESFEPRPILYANTGEKESKLLTIIHTAKLVFGKIFRLEENEIEVTRDNMMNLVTEIQDTNLRHKYIKMIELHNDKGVEEGFLIKAKEK